MNSKKSKGWICPCSFLPSTCGDESRELPPSSEDRSSDLDTILSMIGLADVISLSSEVSKSSES